MIVKTSHLAFSACCDMYALRAWWVVNAPPLFSNTHLPVGVLLLDIGLTNADRKKKRRTKFSFAFPGICKWSVVQGLVDIGKGVLGR